MGRQVFVNLPVKDLGASVEFFARLGFPAEPRSGDAAAACVVLGENAFAMLHTRENFLSLIPNGVCDTNRSTEAVIRVTAESRGKVDEIVRNAVRGGGMIFRAPEETGGTYAQAFQDLDGHIWEVVAIDAERAR